MLNAFLYQVSHSFFKKKFNVVMSVVGILIIVGMIILTDFISSESGMIHDVNVVSSGCSILAIVFFSNAFTTISSGDLLFSNSDVVFYLAGPFTPRFNLITPIVTSIRRSILLIWVLGCQGPILSNLLGVNAMDMVILLVGSFFILTIGFIVSQVFNSLFFERKGIRRIIEVTYWLTNIIFVVGSFCILCKEAGSVGAISSLGPARVISIIGDNFFIRIIPVAGWFSLIYKGIYFGSVIDIVLGVALTIAVLALLVILTNNSEMNYYERALESAQKIADRLEAQRTGVEGSVVDTKKIKIGKTQFKCADGAKALYSKHMLENKRISKVFFVNKLALFYKVFVVVYITFLNFSLNYSATDGSAPDQMGAVIPALTMMAIFDTIIFAGGRPALELNRATFYLIPEKISVKLFYNVMSCLPEIVFNAILTVAIVLYCMRDYKNIPLILTTFAFVMLYDFLCVHISIIVGSVFRYLGKTLLMFLRYILFWCTVGLGLIVALIITAVLSLDRMFILYFLSGIVLIMILLSSFIAAKVVERRECV